MLDLIHRSWEQLKSSRPGRRFRDWHRRHHENHPRQAHHQALLLLAGALAMAAGLVMMVTPGPGLIGIGLGAALLALASHTVARMLDTLEIKSRRGARWGERWWRRRSTTGRAFAVFCVLAVLAALSYALLRWLMS